MSYLTLFNYNSTDIEYVPDHDFFNGTQMAKAAGKEIKHWLQTTQPAEIAYELAVDNSVVGIPTTEEWQEFSASDKTKIARDNKYWSYIRIHQGGNFQGTYLHKYVAVGFAQWCSPRFGLQVAKWTEQLLTHGRVILDEEEALKFNQFKEQQQLMLGNTPLKPRDEFDLSNRIHSWAALCGYNYVIECPLVNTVNTKTKTRRLDMVKFNGRNIVAIELKLNRVTGKDVYTTVVDREYINLLRAYSNRPVKLIMMSPYDADDEAYTFIQQSKENIEFKTVSQFCEELFYKGLMKKWISQPYYLRNMIFYNEFQRLFRPEFVEEQRAIAKVREFPLAA